MTKIEKQYEICRTALIQIVNDPEMAVKYALKAINDCHDLEIKNLYKKS